MLNENQKHIFSFYVDRLSFLLSSVKIGDLTILKDKNVCRRIMHVLRLHLGDMCVLFDSTINAHFLIQKLGDKQGIYGIIKQKKYNKILQPHITSLLPLLKRNDIDTALYSLVEMGVNSVQLMITQKVQREWGKEKEAKRLQRIIIAAAEQSKNFNIPLLHPPQSFEQVIAATTQSTVKIYFDPAGKSLLEIITRVKKISPVSITVMVGPEGDLTNQEKEQLKKSKFLFCALTPTVLRSSQAIALGSGIIRSTL